MPVDAIARTSAAVCFAAVRHGEPELVDLVREFIASHELMSNVIERGRSGALRWPEVQRLVAEDESSRLYRLKERSHLLSRSRHAGDDLSRTALLDLAVGSLFHEAMKLRENFYQLEVYAPRVARAESTAAPGTEVLFGEFARILSASRERVVEAIDECAALLDQMREQLRQLLVEYADDGLVMRFLFENRDAAEGVIGEPIDVFFARSLGEDPAETYARVARSYLESGFFDEGLGALEEALARRPQDPALLRDRLYAVGMAAYRRGHYEKAVDGLEEWTRCEIPESDRPFLSLAQSALEGLPALLTQGAAPSCAGRALALAESLAASP